MLLNKADKLPRSEARKRCAPPRRNLRERPPASCFRPRGQRLGGSAQVAVALDQPANRTAKKSPRRSEPPGQEGYRTGLGALQSTRLREGSGERFSTQLVRRTPARKFLTLSLIRAWRMAARHITGAAVASTPGNYSRRAKLRSAHSTKNGTLGPSVWPPSCWRQASCPGGLGYTDRRFQRVAVVVADPQVPRAQQAKHLARGDCRHVASLLVQPLAHRLFRECHS